MGGRGWRKRETERRLCSRVRSPSQVGKVKTNEEQGTRKTTQSSLDSDPSLLISSRPGRQGSRVSKVGLSWLPGVITDTLGACPVMGRPGAGCGGRGGEKICTGSENGVVGCTRVLLIPGSPKQCPAVLLTLLHAFPHLTLGFALKTAAAGCLCTAVVDARAMVWG